MMQDIAFEELKAYKSQGTMVEKIAGFVPRSAVRVSACQKAVKD